MRAFIHTLKEVVSNHCNDNTVRKIIILKDEDSYEDWLLELQQYNIIPYRKVKLINMLCFHINEDDDVLQRLREHPSVHTIETDAIKQLLPFMRTSSLKSRYSKGLQAVPRKQTSYSPNYTQNYSSPYTPQEIPPSQIPWWVARVNAPDVWGCTMGAGIKVAVLDTGISPHPDLSIAGGVNIVQPGQPYSDNVGHGTAVAGVVAATGNEGMQFGIAPAVSLYAVKISDQRTIMTSDAIAGLEWCIQNNMDVANLSYGSPFLNVSEQLAVQAVYGRGIVMSAAAGNSGPNTTAIDYPAGFSETIAVAATNEQNQVANFSNRGPGIDVSAPGEDIVTTTNTGGFASFNGTSFSAPNVSGIVALMLDNQPTLSPDAVKNILVQTAMPLPGFTQNAQGAGLVRANLAVSDCEQE